MTSIPASINKIFWGLMFVLIDINIVIIDVLPDIIGYFIVVSGLTQLQFHSAYFSKAKVLAVILALASLVLLFLNPPIPMEEFRLSNIKLSSLLVSTTNSILHLFLIIYIVHGLMEMAEKAEFMMLAQSAKKGLIVYIIGILATLTVFPFVWNVSDSKGFSIITICIVITVIMEIIILVLLRQFRSRFMKEL